MAVLVLSGSVEGNQQRTLTSALPLSHPLLSLNKTNRLHVFKVKKQSMQEKGWSEEQKCAQNAQKAEGWEGGRRPTGNIYGGMWIMTLLARFGGIVWQQRLTYGTGRRDPCRRGWLPVLGARLGLCKRWDVTLPLHSLTWEFALTFRCWIF